MNGLQELATEIINYEEKEMIPLTGKEIDLYEIQKALQLAEHFKDQFECLGENTERCITFSAQIKKEVANDDNSKKKKTITYKLKFIDSYRFMQSKLSDLVDNLPEITKKECPKCMGKKTS